MVRDGVGMELDGDDGGGVLRVAITTTAESLVRVTRRVRVQVRREHESAGSAMMNLRKA